MSLLLLFGGTVTVTVTGAVTERADTTTGTIRVSSSVVGAVTEGADTSAGTVAVSTSVVGAVVEGADVSAGSVLVSDQAADVVPASITRRYGRSNARAYEITNSVRYRSGRPT